MSSLRIRALAVTAAAAAIVSGGAAVADAAAHHRATVNVHVASTHHVSAPRSTRPGLARIHNTGRQPVFLARPRGHWGPATLAHDLESPTVGAMEHHFAMIDLIPGRTSIYARLVKGTYYLVPETGHLTAAKVRTMSVSGRRIDAGAPSSSRIAIDAHNRLTAPATLSRRHYLHVLNSSGNMQQVVLFGISSKASDQAVATAVANPSLRNLSRVVTNARMIATLDRHRALYTSPAGVHGRFLLVALTIRKHHNTLRFAKGQVRLVTVPGS